MIEIKNEGFGFVFKGEHQIYGKVRCHICRTSLVIGYCNIMKLLRESKLLDDSSVPLCCTCYNVIHNPHKIYLMKRLKHDIEIIFGLYGRKYIKYEKIMRKIEEGDSVFTKFYRTYLIAFSKSKRKDPIEELVENNYH